MFHSIFKTKFSLHLHVIALFTTLIIISGASLGWNSYQQLSENMINSGRLLFNNSSQEIVNKVRNETQHVQTMLQLVQSLELTKDLTHQKKLETLPLLSEMLKNTTSLSALFIAYANNDFFLYREVKSKTIFEKYSLSPDTFFMMTLRESGKTIHHFYDFEGTLLKIFVDPSYDLNIQNRPWYHVASNNNYASTNAYLFHENNELGITISIKNKNDQSIIGADYTLANISKSLKGFKNYISSQNVIINKKEQVIAYKDIEKLQSKEGKINTFTSVSDIDQPALAYLFKHYKSHKGSVLFSFNGEDWLGDISSISPQSGMLLLQVVKTKELLPKAYQLRNKNLFITFLIIIGTLPIAWYFSQLLTRPLNGLAEEIERIRDFDFSKKIGNKTSIQEINDLIGVTNNMKATISHFKDLATSLVNKQNFDELLNKISQECNKLPNSQGTIIILKDKNKHKIKHCSISNLSPLENDNITSELVDFTLLEGDLDTHLVNLPIPHKINQTIKSHAEKELSLRNWQLIAMQNKSGKQLGLIAILVSKDTALNHGKLQYAKAVASFSALAIQSQQLLTEQKELLDSFIHLIADAIDSKSPYTGGHCARVPELTKMISIAACEEKEGCYKDFNLTEDQREELHIAAWLHDCGKILTPEYIVDKGTKLETIYDRLNEVRMRFELLKMEAQKNYWMQLSKAEVDKDSLIKQRDHILQKLDIDFEFVANCNIGGEFMSDDKIIRLQSIASQTWTRTLSNKIGIAPDYAKKISDTTLPIKEALLCDKNEHLVDKEHSELTKEGNQWGFNMDVPDYRFNRGELYNLSIKCGTLTPEDRFIINGHMLHTIVMLSNLAFPDHLKNIATIAGGHHEKMDGTGYPRRIKAATLPITARMMVIADIFEALTASDRPYKDRKTLSEALNIMKKMVQDNHIDPDVFDLFLTSGVYLEYANNYLLAEQVDHIDITNYLQPTI